MECDQPLTADANLPGSDLRLAVGRLARRMRQLYADADASFAETSVLARLERAGPATPTMLAAVEHVRPQAMGATLNALAAQGLICRRNDPADGRRVWIELTAAGRQMLADRHTAIDRLIERALAGSFSDDERRTLASALPLLDRLAEQL